MKPRILALSSSKEGNNGYLETAVAPIRAFLGDAPLNIAFIPFASVNTDYEVYTDKVRFALKELPHTIQTADITTAKTVIEEADAIMTGGGNTFKLLHDLYFLQVLELIKEKIKTGTPYIGWSAGANIAGATICTSNDMPIINPGSFKALAFFPFQINPHYYNQTVAGFNGETRNQRLEEFLQLNPSLSVVALPEGTALLAAAEKLQLTGSTDAWLFRRENNTTVQTALTRGEDISYLLQ